MSKIVIIFLITIFAFGDVWQLPNVGLKLENSEKQSYMREQMSAFFSGASLVKFNLPKGWEHIKFNPSSVKMEL